MSALDDLKLTAVFVPQSLSRNRDTKDDKGQRVPSLNWRLAITGPSGYGYAFDYTQGIGHVPGYRFTGFRMSIEQAEWQGRLEAAAETGRYPINALRIHSGMVDLAPPRLRDVLESLLLDAEAINHTFTEWANGFGYSDDSIRAKAMYDECIQTAIEMQRVIAPHTLDAIREELEAETNG